MPPSRFARRGIGQADGEVSFDVSAELAQGKAALTTAQNVTSAVQQFGDAPTSAQQQQVWAGIVAAGNQIVPGAGSAVDALFGLLPKAGSGPGSCVSDPPAGPLDTGWKYYLNYSQIGGSYAPPPAGSFEAFSYPLLVKNAELAANCYPQLAIPFGQLLAGLIAGWNATHNGPTRTIARIGLNSFSGDKDPIAYALAQALMTNTGPGFNATVPSAASIVVNSGSRKPKYVPGLLHLTRPAAVSAKPPVGKTSGATQIVETTAIVGGAAALVWTALRLATRKPIVPSGAGARLRRLLGRR